ncbi:uncharacterized protein HD556DRAFT_1535720 [Suillus plorans]|uniref:Uncharacterized protein n=1 Tax=Suillus plorans TaxID=116603 RepID=A0A9P7AT25_9AGAM|nr:uncharacterized protein HD556DRAFT_1535720 [Suillus plorans]KAG1795761.1 hypothetical protein HD556DRAFT_1535720 [Suillus plorans]
MKKPHFDHVDADDLIIWKVKVNLNDLHLLDAIGNQGVKLKPLTELSEVFTGGVEHGCIHVVDVLNTNSTGHIQEFSYDETPTIGDRLIFFGETVGNATGSKICIKFVRHYYPEAHEFCARMGHAPKLIAYNHLPGGWNMPLEEVITSLIRELHDYNDGYVHGDLRDTNFVVGDNKHFMLLDFDWAGPIHKTHYFMHVNRKDIRRPDGVSDGEKIVAEHDLDILNYLFHPEQDGQDRREPAAKRRRTSGEGSPMAI